MAPFLYSEIYCVLQVLMRWFIKRDVMDKATTPKKLNKIDINSPENVCDPKDVDMGTQAKSYLRKGNITGEEKLSKGMFRVSHRNCFKNTREKPT